MMRKISIIIAGGIRTFLLAQVMSSCSSAKSLTQTPASTSTAQEQGPWKGKKASVVLTYDDALNVHLDHAAPALDSLDFKGTFYLSGYSGNIDTRQEAWRAVARKGHELGNHTLYHPCAGGTPGREFVRWDYDLRNYSLTRLVNEVKMTNTLLKAFDNKTQRTFAYPCSDTKLGDTAYIDPLRKDFTGARAVRSYMPTLNEVDLYYIPSYMINGQTAEEMIALVDQAIAGNKLLVLLFHGVGGEHGLNVSLEAHSKLIKYLKQKESDLWIAPMTEVATYIKDKKSSK
jgi:peptidoglycan/xylan/chitin deacetylase (PgdA/CDA1 family)